jgi:ribosomal protein S2
LIQIRKALNTLFNRIKVRGFLTIYAHAIKAIKYNHISIFSFVTDWVPGLLTNNTRVNGAITAYKKYMAQSKTLLKRSQLKAIADTYQKVLPLAYFIRKRKRITHKYRFPSISLSILDSYTWLHECVCLKIPSIQICDTQSHLEKASYPIIANQRSIAFSQLIVNLAIEVCNTALLSSHLNFIAFYKYHGKKSFITSFTKKHNIRKKTLALTLAELVYSRNQHEYKKSQKQWLYKLKPFIRYGLEQERLWYEYRLWKSYRRSNQHKRFVQKPLISNKRTYIFNNRFFTYQVKDLISTKTTLQMPYQRQYKKMLRRHIWNNFMFLKKVNLRLTKLTTGRKGRQRYMKYRESIKTIRKLLNQMLISILSLKKALSRMRKQKRRFLNQTTVITREIKIRIICSFFPIYFIWLTQTKFNEFPKAIL